MRAQEVPIVSAYRPTSRDARVASFIAIESRLRDASRVCTADDDVCPDGKLSAPRPFGRLRSIVVFSVRVTSTVPLTAATWTSVPFALLPSHSPGDPPLGVAASVA